MCSNSQELICHMALIDERLSDIELIIFASRVFLYSGVRADALEDHQVGITKCVEYILKPDTEITGHRLNSVDSSYNRLIHAQFKDDKVAISSKIFMHKLDEVASHIKSIGSTCNTHTVEHCLVTKKGLVDKVLDLYERYEEAKNRLVSAAALQKAKDSIPKLGDIVKVWLDPTDEVPSTKTYIKTVSCGNVQAFVCIETNAVNSFNIFSEGYYSYLQKGDGVILQPKDVVNIIKGEEKDV